MPSSKAVAANNVTPLYTTSAEVFWQETYAQSSGQSQLSYNAALRRLRLYQAYCGGSTGKHDEDPEACDVYDTLWSHDLRTLYGFRTGEKAPMDLGSCISHLRELDCQEPWNGDYERCSINEMRRFIMNRTGRLPPPGGRDTYVARLRQLDASVTFKLLDLPLELRQNIYRQLIVGDVTSPAQHYNRSLLSVSRQVRAEVQDVASVEDPPRISIMREHYSSVLTRIRIMGVSRLLMNTSAAESDLRGFTLCLQNSRFLHKFPRLIIELGATRKQCPGTEFAMYTLASILSLGALRHLKVYYVGSEDYFTDDELGILEQLTILDDEVQLSLQGFPESAQARFETLERPQRSSLVDFVRVRRDVVELVKRLKQASEKSAEAVYLSYALAALKKEIDSARAPDSRSFVDEAVANLANYAATVKARHLTDDGTAQAGV